MPVVSFTLDDSNRTILQPTYNRVIKDISEMIKIPKKTDVIITQQLDATLTDHRGNVSNITGDNLPSTVSKRRIYAIITEDYNEEELTMTAVHQYSAYPIFADNDVSVYVYPIYVKSDVSIEFKYITPSKIEASRIRDDIRIRLSQTRNIYTHELEYTVLVPEVVEEFIADVYDLKNRLIPLPLLEYFREHSSKRIYPITDMSNVSNIKLGIHEKQVRVIGNFDFTMPDKIEVNNDNNNYEISFTYKFSLDVPRAMVMRYPVLICNRPLPTKYLSFIEENKLQSKEEIKKNLNYTSKSLSDLSIFEAHRQLENRVDIKIPINIPAFDDFNLRQGYRGYGIMVSFLTQIDETDYRSLLNLTDIDPYALPEPLLRFIREVEYNYITKPGHSFLYLGLHQEGIYFDSPVLKVDPQLNVSSTKELSLFKPCRITLSIILDLDLLSDEAYRRLFGYIDVLLLFLNEYITALWNYKPEYVHRNKNKSFQYDFAFIDRIIEALKYFMNAGDLVTVCKILGIVIRDKYTSYKLAQSLYHKHKELYKQLLQNDLLLIDPVTYQMKRLCGIPNPLVTSTGAPNSFNPIAIRVNENVERLRLRDSIMERLIKVEGSTSFMKTVMSNYTLVNKIN